jgi:hypothetical protein
MNLDGGHGHNIETDPIVSTDHKADHIRFVIITFMSIKTAVVCRMMHCTVADGY